MVAVVIASPGEESLEYGTREGDDREFHRPPPPQVDSSSSCLAWCYFSISKGRSGEVWYNDTEQGAERQKYDCDGRDIAFLRWQRGLSLCHHQKTVSPLSLLAGTARCALLCMYSYHTVPHTIVRPSVRTRTRPFRAELWPHHKEPSGNFL
jgi:hypothetical protein